MYIGLHNHTDHSNYRMLDSTIRPKELIEYTHQLGHNGVAITDHESLGAHMIALHFLRDKKQEDEWKDFKLVLGNEIYLCSRAAIEEEKQYNFYHFILLAKNARGHRALRELSSIAWCENSFTYVNQRVPTYYDNLFPILREYKGDLIGSTACVGSVLGQQIFRNYLDSGGTEDHYDNSIKVDLSQMTKWVQNMQKAFGPENFFLELQPGNSVIQLVVNDNLLELSKITGVPYIITTDSHYLNEAERPIHQAFLQSQEADREVGEFYASTYVMNEEEIHSKMDAYIGADKVQKGIDNTQLIYNMVEEYSLDNPLNIPYMPRNTAEPDPRLVDRYKGKIELLQYFVDSQYPSDHHLVREITNFIHEHPEDFENEKAYEAVNTCLNSIKLTSEKQNTPWSAYLLQTQEIVNICWESGSLVGAARGSGCGFVLLYMLGITQINPLKEEVKTYHWRFLNPQRVSPLDIDIDIQGSLRDVIINNLQEHYGGYRHVVKVQTLLTAKSRNALQIAGRGLGVTPEETTFLGSFINGERGIQYTLAQVYYGDPSMDLAPNTEFVNLINTKYADLWEVAQRIEGLCVGVGQHAGGVVLCKEDIVESAPLMKTKGGDIITQFDLHKLEDTGLIKNDILAIDALEKEHIAINLLLEDGFMTWQGTLKDTYEKYLGVYNLERDNPEIWDMIDKHKILSLFQFEKQSGWQAIELGKPRTLEEMSALNSVMRLMAQEDGELPLERYSRFRKDITLWYKEMDEYGLTKEEQAFVRKHAEKTYGLLPNQEQFMQIVQEPEVGGYGLLWSDQLRKAIAKKNPAAFDQLEKEFYENIETKQLSFKCCDYVWQKLISMNKGYGFNTLSWRVQA